MIIVMVICITLNLTEIECILLLLLKSYLFFGYVFYNL